MAILPISNIINVTITNTPTGLNEKNVNSLALFSHEQTNSLNPFDIYVSASQVANDYGTSSITALMANAIFAQTPNILSGDGRLVIIPLRNAASATEGNFQSANISANLSSITLVSSGDLRVIANGIGYNLTGMNFTNCVTWADVATIIQNQITDATIAALTNGISVTSKKVGAASTVALGAVPGGTGTQLNGAGYINASAGTSVAGQNSSGETLLQAIARTSGTVGYVPVMSTLDLEDGVILAISNGIQALDNMYFQHAASTQDIAGICTTIQQAGNTRTRMTLYTNSMASSNLMKAAYAGRALSVDYTGSLTSQTMNLKQLDTIDPDNGITQTLYVQADTAGVDLYVSFDGVPSVYSTGGNDFFDNVYSDLALKFALESAGFNFLRQTNTKVPQTETGMNGLKSAYAGVCEQFTRCGSLAPGAWQSSETFGDPQIFRTNVSINGYYIYSLPVAQQAYIDRDARKAPLVQIAVKRAGAIQTSDCIVLVNN